MASKKCLCCFILIAGGVVAIMIAALVGTSVKTLQSYEVGLHKDTTAITIDSSKLYEQGRHFLGPGHSFISFPKDVKTVELTQLPVRSQDALKVDVDATFQYRLKIVLAELVDVYYKWGTDYENAYIKIARNTIRDVASEYEAFDLFSQKNTVALEMKNRLTDAIGLVHATIDDFQLLDLKFPTSLSQALEETQQKRSEQQTKLALIEREKIDATGTVQKAQEEAQGIIFTANAKKVEIESAASAEYQTLSARLSQEKQTLSDIKTNLGFSSSEFIDYYFLTGVNLATKKGVLGVTMPNLIKCFALNDASAC